MRVAAPHTLLAVHMEPWPARGQSLSPYSFPNLQYVCQVNMASHKRTGLFLIGADGADGADGASARY